MKSLIYLDYNATTPVDPQVIRVMEPFLREHFGNPSSTHAYGSYARQAIEEARLKVARLIGADPWEIIFTSGGTESNNLAIQGVARALRNRGRHIITSQIEHPAVLEVCRYLEGEDYDVTYLPVDSHALVDPASLKDAIRTDTILVTIMHANNEVGTIQSIAELSAIARQHGIPFHTDAAQSAGKIAVSVNDLGVDLLSLAGHKLYAPKGVGALFVRRGVPIEKILFGADHEQNRRPGTENVLEIVGLGEACRLALAETEESGTVGSAFRDRLQELITLGLPDAEINGHPIMRLPNTLSISFPNLEAQTILGALNGVAASAGAACHAGDSERSGVLDAMGVPMHLAMGTLRFSTGRYTTDRDVEEAARRIIDAVGSLSGEAVAEPGYSDIKLTHFTHGLGCACKLRPQDLEQVIRDLPKRHFPNVMVGTETSDDAAVYRIREDLALVETVDFFTPVVDDPRWFGAIAAANALSDIYAMGARPLFALNIVGFPAKRLPLEVLRQILLGADEKAAEAGIPVLGGHTIEDNEPKYGMVVTGEVHPDRIWTNRGALPGNKLILTKAIGTGILSTALKRGLLDEQSTRTLYETMATLNMKAAEVLHLSTVHACTDVTGFGLLGHLLEMTRGSGVNARIFAGQVPLLDGAMQHAASGIIPGGTLNNRAYTSGWVSGAMASDELMLVLLNDAQTSGGLLVAADPGLADELVDQLVRAGVASATLIGEITTKGTGLISIDP